MCGAERFVTKHNAFTVPNRNNRRLREHIEMSERKVIFANL